MSLSFSLLLSLFFTLDIYKYLSPLHTHFLSLCLSLAVSLSLTLSLSLSLSFSMSLSFSLLLSLFFTLDIYKYLSPLHTHFLSLCLSLAVSLSLSLSLSLAKRKKAHNFIIMAEKRNNITFINLRYKRFTL